MAELTAPSHGGKRQPANQEWWLGAGSTVALLYTAVMATGRTPSIDCPSQWILHAPCPGCGMTRALWFTLTGPIDRMLALHPVAPLVLLALVVHATIWIVSFAGPRGRALAHRAAPALRMLRWSAFIAVAAWGVLRICLVWLGILSWDLALGVATHPAH